MKQLHRKALVALPLILISACVSVTSASAGVHGEPVTLTEDTTWTADQGPIELTGPVIVPTGVTLTIEPGVTVTGAASYEFETFAPSWFSVDGSLEVRGTESDPVLFQVTSDNNNYALVSGKAADDRLTGIVKMSHVAIPNTPFLTPGSPGLAVLTLADSTWGSHNEALQRYVPATGDLSDIPNLTLSHNAIYGGVGDTQSYLTIGKANPSTVIVGNRFRGIVVGCGSGALVLRGNTFERWPDGVGFGLNGSAVRSSNKCAVDARDNYWETNASLADRIFDGSDLFGYTVVDASRRLTARAAGTPTMPPAPLMGDVELEATPLGLAARWKTGSDGGLPVSFTAYAIPAGSTQPEQSRAAAADGVVFRGLDTSQAYFVRRVARNAVGSTTTTSRGSATPVAEATAPRAPSNVRVTRYIRSASVSWLQATDGGTPITQYNWTLTGSNGATLRGSEASTYADVTGLAPGVQYTFSVYASNAVGRGTDSSPATFTAADAPSPPARTTAAWRDTAARVSWTEASNNFASPVTSYQVQAYPSGRIVTTSSTARAVRFTGLRNGIRYSFRVRARNEFGYGALSTPSNVVTPAGVPTKPRRVKAYSRHRAARVNWWAAAANGRRIRSYRVTAYPGRRTVTVGPAARGVRVTRLRKGRVYRLTVRANNVVGAGQVSVASRRIRIR